MKACMKKFIQTGWFGDLTLGQDRNRVNELLGAAEKISADTIKALIWKYGNLEITFGLEKKIASIEILMDIDFQIWPTIEMVDFEKYILLNKEEFLNLLGDSEYRFGKKTGESEILFLPNHVKVGFEHEKISSVSIIDASKIP